MFNTYLSDILLCARTSRFTVRESLARQVRTQLACRGFPIRWKRLFGLFFMISNRS
jgi:hypothetical protein